LVGDASKAHARLGWQPGTSFEDLVVMMVEAELNVLRKGVSRRLARTVR
jgi:GDPmannose 4,6-dehydratase